MKPTKKKLQQHHARPTFSLKEKQTTPASSEYQRMSTELESSSAGRRPLQTKSVCWGNSDAFAWPHTERRCCCIMPLLLLIVNSSDRSGQKATGSEAEHRQWETKAVLQF